MESAFLSYPTKLSDSCDDEKNKAGYTAIQSRMVWQGRCENCSGFKNVTDLPTDRPTRRGVESRVRD